MKQLSTIALFILSCALVQKAHSQMAGSFSANIVNLTGDVSIRIRISTRNFSFDDPHGYWFTNPHNSDRHFNLQPDAGYGNADAAFITINNPSNNFERKAGDESNQLTLQSKEFLIEAPQGGGLQFQITTFTASEIAFTLRGIARYGSATSGQWLGTGKIEGSGHFFREPKYDYSDKLPGCDCDPVIYGVVYDDENKIRTTSACEMALKNKIFDAVQKSVAPLFTNIRYNGPDHPIPVGAITITPLPGHVDVSVPVKQRPYCSSDYRTNSVTGLDAHKKLYEDEDSYGLQFIKMPSAEELNPPALDGLALQRKMMRVMDSLNKLMTANKITSEQVAKAMTDMAKPTSSAARDFKKMDMEHTLKMWININPSDKESTLVKLVDKAHTAVQHTVKGASFEIFTGQAIDSDGNWVSNRMAIYLGKFSAPLPGKSGGGYDALVTTAQFPGTSNRLLIYAIVVRLEGGKEIMDKAIANIDFSALNALITPE